jgi:CO/xanthine dehydrogenase Mo-binding subunit
MLAVAAQRDPVEFRLQALTDPRAVEVIRRTAALIGWQPRATTAPRATGSGRGFAYIHYKHNESYVAIAMEADVDKASGAIRVRRVACAHDCGLVINPRRDAQIEATSCGHCRARCSRKSRSTGRVTSVDWATYPILRFPMRPKYWSTSSTGRRAAARRGEAARHRCLQRSRTPCSTRSACGSRRCRSAAACARRSPDAVRPAVR